MKFDIFGRGFSLRLAITVACEMAFILFGYDQGVFSGIVGNTDFLNVMNHPSPGLLGIIVSIYNLGCFSGCILNFFFGIYFGRRLCMWIAMAWIIVGAALQASAFSVPHLMVARFVTGIGTGIETSTVPMYQAELCKAHQRGRLVCSEALFVGVGIVIAYWFDYGLHFNDNSIAWRVPIACQVVFCFVVIVLVFGLPESPRYLYVKGKNEEALKVLCDVYDHDPNHPDTVKEQNDILEAIALESQHTATWWDIFKQDEVQTGKRVALAYGMQFMNQMGGINLVVYFVPTVLQENVGLTRNLSLLLGGVIQCMFVIGSFVPSLLVDKVGRRWPMMIGSAGLGISMMLISILLSFKGSSNEKSTSAASVAFFFTYMLIFGASVNCIPWVYVPEILPLKARAKGTAVGISSNWLWNFFVVMITPVIITNLQYKAYIIFVCTNFAFIPLIYFCYPETMNLTLEEIDYLYTKPGVSARKVADELRKSHKQHGASPEEAMIEQEESGKSTPPFDVHEINHEKL
ncbi:general substrate transporter [Rhizodiscina lignyota]|uniref:General substrate transporter n=1 Tax=Rhizodiscina lignyota TaxID=1504668 RepID=A0A9P4I4D6_9PEZI|nr:general substrate transporter [Rhizodiscina lignyota]